MLINQMQYCTHYILLKRYVIGTRDVGNTCRLFNTHYAGVLLCVATNVIQGIGSYDVWQRHAQLPEKHVIDVLTITVPMILS